MHQHSEGRNAHSSIPARFISAFIFHWSVCKSPTIIHLFCHLCHQNPSCSTDRCVRLAHSLSKWWIIIKLSVYYTSTHPQHTYTHTHTHSVGVTNVPVLLPDRVKVWKCKYSVGVGKWMLWFPLELSGWCIDERRAGRRSRTLRLAGQKSMENTKLKWMTCSLFLLHYTDGIVELPVMFFFSFLYFHLSFNLSSFCYQQACIAASWSTF